MKVWKLALASLLFWSYGVARADTSIEPNRLTAGLVLQSTGYEDDDGHSFDVDGQILEVGYKGALSPKFSLGGGLGLMVDGEEGDTLKLKNGEGFRLWVDGQFEAHKFDNNKILVTGTLVHDSFKFKRDGFSSDFAVTELKVGGLFLHQAREFSLYGGLEVVAYSHGTVDVPGANIDINRDDRVNVRLGASFNATRSVDLRAEVLLIGEETVLLAADFAL